MNTATKIGLYAAGLAVIFAASFATAAAVVPDETAQKNSAQGDAGMNGMHESTATNSSDDVPVRGLSVAEDGYALTSISAPDQVEVSGEISFVISGPDGMPVTDYQLAHTKDLHLIVVRTDGTQFRHVHPVMDGAGTWSLPWQWEKAGSYRLYADFVPAAGGETLTLTSTVEVGGDFDPERATEVALTDEVAGFEVSLIGELSSTGTSEITLSVNRDGLPVTTLQPYLGAYGHLVALRAGDLAYLHVHPEGEEPQGESLSGPEIVFMTQAPSAGRYLLYLDFQVDGVVHTAEFVVDTSAAAGTDSSSETVHGDDTTAPAGHGH